MGEIADDMISGLTCSHCGVFFASEHGYPVLCEDCFKDDGGTAVPSDSRLRDTMLGKSKIQKATMEEL